VPILPDFTSDEIQHIVNHSDSRLLFVSAPIFDAIDEHRMPRLEAILALNDFGLCHCPHPKTGTIVASSATAAAHKYRHIMSREGLRFDRIASDSLASLCYTSGTTGFSKGVMVTHNSLMTNVRFYIDNLKLTANNTVVSFLPLAHSFGCAFEFLSPTICGCHVTFIEKTPTPRVLMEAFTAVKPWVILSVPLIIEKIYRQRIKPQLETRNMQFLLKVPLINDVIRKQILAKVRDVFGNAFQEVVVGGAAINSEVETFFRALGFPLASGYGMTECGPLISYSVVADNPPLGSVGKVIPYLECKIELTDPEHGIGEIFVRGDQLMLGYYKDEAATQTAIDPDGWFHTGDLGRFDENGNLFLTGRSKNMLLSASGQNIYPEEIEAKLNNLACVGESLVLDNAGKLVALVYPDMDVVDDRCIDENRLTDLMEQNRKQLNEMLPAYSAVSRIKLVFEELEKTPTKKIKRHLYEALR
jgi:long-chain acyl-CoA synthetase